MNEETLGFLGLMRRAGALALGAEDAFDAARGGRARLLCLAADAAKNTRDGLGNALDEGKCPMLTLPFSKRALGSALGIGECAALAVLDTGFALALCEKLGEEALVPPLREKLEREKKRRAKKLARRGASRQTKPNAPRPGAHKSGAAARIAARDRGKPRSAGTGTRRTARRTDRSRATEQRGN